MRRKTTHPSTSDAEDTEPQEAEAEREAEEEEEEEEEERKRRRGDHLTPLRGTGSSSPSPKKCWRRRLAPARAQSRNPEGLRTPHLGQSGPRAGLLGAGQKRALGPRKCQAA